ncbi:predicted membrane protein DUF2232 [Bacillus oleivorans]|uniref:Predicted membrane protein DUF2232 n=1 Tax=Bacillus oleivorans TaxID=1448271 RepID=A0A285CV47_9BACI|nr:DUF2232 domain-containing protein [Bacillus oleivorans]SNX70896.1 predicted membrane protein DUF2232 [Bacillus oleivorans]
MYSFFQPISEHADMIHKLLRSKSTSLQNIIVTSLFGTLSAIFQSAGGFFPWVGYLISPLATAPIIFCTILSLKFGLFSYMVSILLLLVIQPSELIVFPFTTGLLGLAIGLAFRKFSKRISIIFFGSLALLAGMMIVLYGFGFPLLGPSIPANISYSGTGILFLFSFFYSWLWTEASHAVFKKIQKLLYYI